MDANGLRFWLLADARHWRLGDGATYDAEHRCLRLASRRDAALSPPEIEGAPPAVPVLPPDGAAGAAQRDALAAPPMTRDRFGTLAWWDPAERSLVAASAGGEELPIWSPSGPGDVTDVAVGHNGVLYIAVGGRVVLHDLRGRWEDAIASAPNGDDFAAWRLATDAAGGMWVLDQTRTRLAHVHGTPIPERPNAPYAPTTVRPCRENPDPPVLLPLGAARWVGGTAVAIACSAAGRLALLATPADSYAVLSLQSDGGRLDVALRLWGARAAYALTWVSERTVAVLVPGLREALVYDVSLDPNDVSDDRKLNDRSIRVDPVGDLYPLRDARAAPFVHTLTTPPYYATARAGAAVRSAPLVRVSAPAVSPKGTAAGRDPIDSGSTETVWHRLYLEVSVPPGCGIRIFLAATNERRAPTVPDEWHEHRVGEAFAADPLQLPRAAWVSYPSELPFHDGLLHYPSVAGRSGLFTVLVQRSNRRVRSLRGRYLWVRLELTGTGRASPEVAAVRAYGSRFSYVDRYLPELYRESEFGIEAEAVQPIGPRARSTRADFLERFVDNFEGVLTLIEDRIAGAYLLTDPRTTRDTSLEWLASWIGVTLDPAYPATRRRSLLEATPALYRMRGTIHGLRAALEVATDGACSRGQIVVIEDFRLRRTFATILGADLADEDDPLLGGIVASGNSFVGDTLFLGDEERKEFLALFAADLPTTPEEQRAIAALFDRLAHRVTVLVHQAMDPQDLGLVRRVVELEKPAHVAALVTTAKEPLLVGMASLVGVDTFLTDAVPSEPARLDRSAVGVRDLVMRPPSLDPRLESGATRDQRPVADVLSPNVVPYGQPFRFDASPSHAAPGRRVVRYSWRMLQ